MKPRGRPAPLSMRELVHMIDESDRYFGVAMSPAIRALEMGDSRESARHFVCVESDFYPQLGACYDARREEFFAKYAPEDDEEEAR